MNDTAIVSNFMSQAGRKSNPAMKSRSVKSLVVKGYTLIELAMVIAIVGVLTAFGLVSFGNMDEQRDASMVQSVQASLQSIVSQGAARLDIRPADFQNAQLDAVLMAAQGLVARQAANNPVNITRSGRTFTLTIPSSGRGAQYAVDANGNVNLVPNSLQNFATYTVQNGVIQKGP